MTSQLIAHASATQKMNRPEVRPGYTVRVHERIQEGNKERVQVFEGLVIAVHKGHNPTDSTFTVRRIVSGVGVEKIFSLHSPKIEKLEVKKVAKIRRSKLFFLRGRRGKAARLSERFTTADEFAVAAEVAAEIEEEVLEDASAEEVEDSKEANELKEAPIEDEKEETNEAEESKEAKEEDSAQDSKES